MNREERVCPTSSIEIQWKTKEAPTNRATRERRRHVSNAAILCEAKIGEICLKTAASVVTANALLIFAVKEGRKSGFVCTTLRLDSKGSGRQTFWQK